MATLFGMYPFLQKLFADAGYQGPEFSTALAKVRPHLTVEIVKRSDRTNGFVVLPKRWIVERTLAWLNRCRRLAKDWENAIAKRWRSCTSPQSGSCLESYAIQPKVFGQTLRRRSPFPFLPSFPPIVVFLICGDPVGRKSLLCGGNIGLPITDPVCTLAVRADLIASDFARLRGEQPAR